MLIHSPKELALMSISQRKKLKLSQSAVGKLVGLKQQTISAFEIKPQATQLDTLFRIMAALNLEMQLLPRDEASLTKAAWTEEW